MKSEYSSPVISVEVLEKTDILMASAEVIPSTSELSKSEKENAYRDIADFFTSGDWFSD